MDEQRMVEFLEQMHLPGEGTFFCTQYYEALSRSRHEQAPHPYLEDNTDWGSELNRMRRLFPKAAGWRAHSCVYSHFIAKWLGENCYRYASTSDQLGRCGITPCREGYGTWQMPIYYMDNLDFSDRRFWGSNGLEPFSPIIIERALTMPGMYVFDFHPIHLMLNSPNFEFYAAARDGFKSGASLATLSFKGYGARNFYNHLVDAMEARDVRSVSMDEGLAMYLAANTEGT